MGRDSLHAQGGTSRMESRAGTIRDKNIDELLTVKRKSVLKDPFKYTCRAISFHDQTEGTDAEVSAYYSHKDKVGNIVCFGQLAGVSYNFVAMESKKEQRVRREGKGCARDGLRRVQTVSGIQGISFCVDREKIEKFEADFMKKATQQGLPRVYRFPAKCWRQAHLYSSRLPPWYNHSEATRWDPTCSACIS